MALKTLFCAFKHNFIANMTAAMTLAYLISSKESAAALCGKVDAGAAFVHIDVLQSGHTDHTMDLAAFKGDATILLFEGYGIALKPTVLVGGSDDGNIFSGGVGLAHCTPIYEGFMLTPSVGVMFTDLKTEIDLPVEFMGLEIGKIKNIREKFRSISPYVGLDATYTFCKNWRVCLMVQYSWSRTHTTFKKKHVPFDLPEIDDKSKSHSQGFNYGAMLEYDLCKQWTVQVGAAYNLSLSKEKHGLRGYGFKLGAAYWF